MSAIKNKNTNGVEHAIIKDSLGQNISEFDLDNEKVFSIDVIRGKSMIVETKMADGSYTIKRYSMIKFEEKYIKVDVLGLVDNNSDNIMQIDIENSIGSRVNVAKFDLKNIEKRVVDVNLDYIKCIYLELM